MIKYKNFIISEVYVNLQSNKNCAWFSSSNFITIFSSKTSNLISDVELHHSAYNNYWSSNL